MKPAVKAEASWPRTTHDDGRAPRWRCIAALLWLAAIASMSASAQPVLEGADVTEAALVDALTPAPPPVLTRSINAAPAPAPKAAKAALLITFETNATVLTADAKRQLDIVGRALNTSRLAGFNFLIEGHADPRGSAERNKRLSEGRAAAVRQYLVQSQSVSEERLTTVGKGDLEPLNSSNPAAPENRRVVFVNMSH